MRVFLLLLLFTAAMAQPLCRSQQCAREQATLENTILLNAKMDYLMDALHIPRNQTIFYPPLSSSATSTTNVVNTGLHVFITILGTVLFMAWLLWFF